MTPTTASWQHRLRHALATVALIEAGDLARGTTSSSAALLAVRAVQDAIAHAEADGATEAELDEVIAMLSRCRNPNPGMRRTHGRR